MSQIHPSKSAKVNTFYAQVQPQQHGIPKNPLNIVDILRTAPSAIPFLERVQKLHLTKKLEEKVSRLHDRDKLSLKKRSPLNTSPEHLTIEEEQELAGAVLLLRHAFTCKVFESPFFRQSALTIIQNIYLFRQRKIFFGTSAATQTEKERQEALLLFSSSPNETTVPLAKTFQHLILARVWDNILNRASTNFLQGQSFQELHEIVEQLNTARNIYCYLCLGLVHKLSSQINALYRQSINKEDAFQIGNFGIMRAAYRYHPNIGSRFSTYASHWIHKEIQRQALAGRLIHISANLVQEYAQSQRQSIIGPKKIEQTLAMKTAYLTDNLENLYREKSNDNTPAMHLEQREERERLQQALSTLSVKSQDIISRKFGLGPYYGRKQSVTEIGQHYGVTRSNIYQLEQTIFKKLRNMLEPAPKA